jgi:hypothetical protein
MVQLAGSRLRVMAQHHGLVAPALNPANVSTTRNEIEVFAASGSSSVGIAARLVPAAGFMVSAAAIVSQSTYDGRDYGYADLRSSVTFAGAMSYLRRQGKVRPYGEIGGWITPDARLEFMRTYMNGAGTAIGVSSPDADMSYYYGRAGIVTNLNRAITLNLGGELGRETLKTKAFTETLSSLNPFEATFAAAQDDLTVSKAFVTLRSNDEAKLGFSLTGAYAQTHDYRSNISARVPGIGVIGNIELGDADWVEYTASISYRLRPAASISVFANGISGQSRLIGSKGHFGVSFQAGF